jgi:hypothetical protein
MKRRSEGVGRARLQIRVAGLEPAQVTETEFIAQGLKKDERYGNSITSCGLKNAVF